MVFLAADHAKLSTLAHPSSLPGHPLAFTSTRFEARGLNHQLPFGVYTLKG